MTLRTCPGGDCDLRTDCVRWITRHEHPHAEAFPIAPWKLVVTYQGARMLTEYNQTCTEFVARSTQSG